MKMAVEMAAVSMEKPWGTSPSGGVRNRDSVPGSWLRDGGGSGRFRVPWLIRLGVLGIINKVAWNIRNDRYVWDVSAFSKPGSLFTYDYSKNYSVENDVGSSFMARTTQDDDSNDSPSSTIVGSCLMARETKVMKSPPSLSSVLDDETENQEELVVLKELYKVRCTLHGEALVKFDFLMDSLKEKDESIEELEYHLNDKERRFNLLRQELKTERCISQGLKQQIETFELDKVKDLETIERAQLLAQELDASKKELEVAHASLSKDLDHLERANKLAKDELKKLGENHDLLQETYKKALESMNDPIIDKMFLVPLLHSLVSMLNLLRNMFVCKRNSLITMYFQKSSLSSSAQVPPVRAHIVFSLHFSCK
ncbi:hypothetical protein QYE76_014249 [Lolium multiflorum]|uniref:Uncharacterized protein n=1 Tax=Lolium multiflorum TaxID=4521 RepID=A0AAD8U2N3_LOLMU|nr:hypothetical protein QYE76_014249 [Lolium multiflorum]